MYVNSFSGFPKAAGFFTHKIRTYFLAELDIHAHFTLQNGHDIQTCINVSQSV